MADQKASGHIAEKTFRTYTNNQGADYAQNRYGYHPNLYERIVDHHTSTGGKLDTVVDVGCGPGTATQTLALYFQNAIGLDPSSGMIAAAKQNGGVSLNGQPIHYEISSAEDLGLTSHTIAAGTVDLITAATSAHWFDMTKFWPRAVQLLRPGGTVAIWTGKFGDFHPSLPNAAKIKVAKDDLEERLLRPYFQLGNVIVENLYNDLQLPWTTTPNLAPELDKSTFYRKEWGTEGNDDAEAEGNEFFMNGQVPVSLDRMEKMLVTASPVLRWQQANPDKVGTDQDYVKLMRGIVERYLHEAGVPPGQEVVRGKVIGVLLMVKKKM